MAVPPLSEQRSLGEHLELETKRFDSLISSVNSAVQYFIEYRSALITAAVTGKIDVRAHKPA
jgi:type I restriction enzyme S subunit